MDFDIQQLAELAAWAYLLIVLLTAGDAVLPVLPAESVVILGGVLASSGDLSLPLVMLAGAVGATIGDNVSYQLGRSANRKGKTPEDMGGRLGTALGWAEAALATRGLSMILFGRFIPAGRTAITFGAGYIKFPRRRFFLSTLAAGSIWAVYAGLLGYLGGEVFQDRWWAGLALGLGLSFALTGLIELVRKLTGRGVSLSDKRDELRRARAVVQPVDVDVDIDDGIDIDSSTSPPGDA